MNKLSLKQKLLFTCLSIALFAPIVGYVAYYFTHQAFSEYHQISTVSFPNLRILSETKAASEKIVGTLWKIPYARNAAESAKFRKDIDENLATIHRNHNEYLEVPFVEGEQDLYEILAMNFKNVLESLEKVKGTPDDQMLQLLREPSFEKSFEGFESTLSDLMHFQSNVSDGRMDRAMELRTTTMKGVVSASILAIVLAGVFGYYFSYRISNILHEISKELSRSGEEVSSAATQIKTSSEHLAQANSEQAASLEETAASIEEMNSMIKKNSENAKDSARMSTESSQKAESGKLVVQKMISAIREIDESNNKIMNQIREGNKRIEEIVKVIYDIGEKTKVINDIVFQTKLLSFNASVEAARAGENGKGFAVVAEEVGNLAQMSGNASKEISELLESSLHRVSSIVSETNSSVQKLVDQGKIKVNEGADIAEECAVVLEEIVSSISRVAQMSHEISSASMEQSQGVQEITKAVHQLDEVTQNNAATSEESSTAAEHLALQASSLKAVVDKLVKTIEGGEPPKTIVTQHHNVVKFERKQSPVEKIETTPAPMKKAAGAEPSHDDPRFEEI